ncbi:hypothetical protein BKA61DRAFT_190451 [Leptodontidium sp. MPI-SDFR-AT-0119]|nr:hypothetical protein BKA61DRAFT_190451 [Leptodontidium sp. MPI-SDFR-AT-0119]
MRFSAFSARCSALARAVSTRARRSLTCIHSSELDIADAGLGIVALVEFVRFARGGELGSNGCVRFRGRPRALVVSTVIDSSSFDSLSNSNELPFGPFLLFLLFFGIFFRFPRLYTHTHTIYYARRLSREGNYH